MKIFVPLNAALLILAAAPWVMSRPTLLSILKRADDVITFGDSGGKSLGGGLLDTVMGNARLATHGVNHLTVLDKNGAATQYATNGVFSTSSNGGDLGGGPPKLTVADKSDTSTTQQESTTSSDQDTTSNAKQEASTVKTGGNKPV